MKRKRDCLNDNLVARYIPSQNSHILEKLKSPITTDKESFKLLKRHQKELESSISPVILDIEKKNLEYFLLECVSRGFLESVFYLLACGVNANTKNRKQESSLHLAIKYNHNECIQLLLQYGANIHAQTSSGFTIFHYAVEYSNNFTFVKELIAKRVNIYSVTKKNQNALHLAAQGGKFENLRYLIFLGLDPKQTASNDRSLLYHSVIGGEVKCIKYLISIGLKFNDYELTNMNKSGKSALNTAILKRYTKCVRYLISLGLFDLNESTMSGNSPLFLSILSKNFKCTILLLTCGNFDIRDKDKSNWTALHVAANIGCFDTVKFLFIRSLEVHSFDIDYYDKFSWKNSFVNSINQTPPVLNEVDSSHRLIIDVVGIKEFNNINYPKDNNWQVKMKNILSFFNEKNKNLIHFQD